MSDETIRIGGERVDADAVTNARLVANGRDIRPLVAALASLLLAVLIPTAVVGGGIDFFTVAPVGIVLFLATPVGLVLWLRSGHRTLVVETTDSTYRERLDEETAETQAKRIVERYGR